MKVIKLTAIFALSLSLFSCNAPKEKSKEENKKTEEVKTKEIDKEITESELNVDSVVKAIDDQKNTIEANIGEPVVVKTTELREKIKQKWEKIEYYLIDGELVRIKTYPYEQITKRTEEFYLDNDNLILAVIEDNGEGERGKPKDELDKLYYFHNGELIKEIHSTEEEEYTLRDSDAEELLVEVREYKDIFSKHSK